jgi:T5SS/PEP-CTERM-associated repeat protein
LLAWPLLLGGRPAYGQSTFWVAAGAGNWNVGVNWSAGLPAALTDAQINNGGTARLFDPGARAEILTLGHNPANIGTLEVLGGEADFLECFVGREGTGTLRITGGGAVAAVHDFNIGAVAGSTGTVNVDGANSTMASKAVSLGGRGTGALSISGGGAVANLFCHIGSSAGSTGTVAVSGANSKLTNSDMLHVGLVGTGSLSITSGGEVNSANSFLGREAVSTGTVIVNGANSKWTNSESLHVGSRGTGSLGITGGGAVSSPTGSIGHEAGSSGTVSVDGAGSVWANSSELRVGNYDSTGSLSITGGGQVTNTSGYIGEDNSSTGTVAVNGVGSLWVNSSELRVGGRGMGSVGITSGGTVLNANGTVGDYYGSGTVTVDGSGSAWHTNGALTIGSNYGTGSLGITGRGAVYSTNGTIGEGDGSRGTALIDGPGSRWNVSTGLTLGLMGGDLGGRGTLEVRNGGVLAAAAGVTLGVNGTLRGNGTIDANVINDGGLIAPGAVPDTAHGTLHIAGDFTEQKSHPFRLPRLQIQLASPASFDKLAVTGNMTLTGQLDITLTGGYVPNGSQSFDILDWGGSLSGRFEYIVLRPFGGMVALDTSQLYTTGVVTLTGPAAPLTADFDDDGDVDGADLLQWRGDFGANALSDADADGDSDGADFLAWQRQLGSGAPAVAAVQSVPEPCALSLI